MLCEPFILPVGRVKENWQNWQDQMRKQQEVSNRLAKEYNAVFVALQSLFNYVSRRPSADHWIWDRIHPTVAGHGLIAGEWLKAVSSRLNFLKKYK